MLDYLNIKRIAADTGFDRCGIAPCRPMPRNRAWFDRWLGHGYQSSLAYMERNADKRFDPARLVEGARTAIVCAVGYKNRIGAGYPAGHRAKVASYACTTDYHTTLRAMLGQMLRTLCAEYPALRGRAFVDTAPLIKFDSRGKLLMEETDEALRDELAKHERAVLPGFYGSTPDGKIKTFSRGGSDITGALVARAIKADVYENWTDVSGFLMADPRIVKNPKQIKTISYKELRELSYMGAGVLHEDAIYPARMANVPINIKNTNDPADHGTMIVGEADFDDPAEKSRIVTGIAGSKDFTVVALYKNMMSSERGFVRRILGILDDYNINFEHLPSGIDTVSVVMSNKDIGDRLDDVLDEFRSRLRPDSIDVLENIALIATVGRRMSLRSGVAARLFTALAEAKVNIRMIDQGSSEMNIIVGVENKDFEKAVRAIYSAFSEEE